MYEFQEWLLLFQIVWMFCDFLIYHLTGVYSWNCTSSSCGRGWHPIQLLNRPQLINTVNQLFVELRVFKVLHCGWFGDYLCHWGDNLNKKSFLNYQNHVFLFCDIIFNTYFFHSFLFSDVMVSNILFLLVYYFIYLCHFILRFREIQYLLRYVIHVAFIYENIDTWWRNSSPKILLRGGSSNIIVKLLFIDFT